MEFGRVVHEGNAETEIGGGVGDYGAAAGSQVLDTRETFDVVVFPAGGESLRKPRRLQRSSASQTFEKWGRCGRTPPTVSRSRTEEKQ